MILKSSVYVIILKSSVYVILSRICAKFHLAIEWKSFFSYWFANSWNFTWCSRGFRKVGCMVVTFVGFGKLDESKLRL